MRTKDQRVVDCQLSTAEQKLPTNKKTNACHRICSKSGDSNDFNLPYEYKRLRERITSIVLLLSSILDSSTIFHVRTLVLSWLITCVKVPPPRVDFFENLCG